MRAAGWALVLAGCGSPVVERATVPPPPAGLAAFAIVVEPPDALVRIDDAIAGMASGYPGGLLAIKPGSHRVELSAPGCQTAYFDVDVPPEGGRLRTRLVCPARE